MKNRNICIKRKRCMILRFCGYGDTMGIPAGFCGYGMDMRIEIQSTWQPCRLLVKFSFSTEWGTYLWHTHSGWISKLRNTIFSNTKLEAQFYHAVWNIFRHLEPFRRGSRVWQTDGRTDGYTERPLAIACSNAVQHALNTRSQWPRSHA